MENILCIYITDMNAFFTVFTFLSTHTFNFSVLGVLSLLLLLVLMHLFLLSSAKEEQCVPEVSGRAAAVGNSRWVTLQPSCCSLWVMESVSLKSPGLLCVRLHFLPRPTANRDVVQPQYWPSKVWITTTVLNVHLSILGCTLIQTQTKVGTALFTCDILTASCLPFAVWRWLQRER